MQFQFKTNHSTETQRKRREKRTQSLPYSSCHAGRINSADVFLEKDIQILYFRTLELSASADQLWLAELEHLSTSLFLQSEYSADFFCCFSRKNSLNLRALFLLPPCLRGKYFFGYFIIDFLWDATEYFTKKRIVSKYDRGKSLL